MYFAHASIVSPRRRAFPDFFPVLPKGILLNPFIAEHVGALPTEAEEIWRYSRISRFDPAHYARVGVLHAEVNAPTSVAVSALVPSGWEPVLDFDTDAFTRVARHEAAPVVLDVAAGVAVSAPVRITNRVTDDGAVVAGRLLIRLGANAELTVIEHVSSPDIDALYLPMVELDLADGANLRYVSVQELGPRVWQVAMTSSRTARDASLRSMAVALGGHYARLRTDAAMTGPGAFNELLAVYFGEGEQVHDIRTIQRHAAPRTTSELLFKGAVEDKATSVYSGLIRIEENGKGSVANQTNGNLVLSPDATAESVPNLEIENNDVRCSHASTIGPIDPDQLYYLESRGVPPEVAERLIVLGFFDDLLQRIPDPALVNSLGDSVRAKFDRRSR